MKKICYFLSILLTTILCISCDESSQKEYIYYNNPFQKLDYGLPSIQLDKYLYESFEDINVSIKDAANTDYVAIFDIDKEPDNGLPYKRIKVNGAKNIVFSIEDLGLLAGDYSVCLYQNKTFYLLDRVEFQVDDEDTNDYKVKKASLDIVKEGKKSQITLSMVPSVSKKLTYKIYWCKDGVRLPEYTSLKRVVKEDVTSDFIVKFNENVIVPQEANQLEIAITEGKSSSYYISIDDSLKLEKSKYIYNYQVLTDIHANPNYGFWSSHFYRALLDIKCLSGNTSGIFTVGDNTDMGSVSHYSHFYSIFDSVFSENKPNIYFTVGNHDYMYFSDSVGGFDAAIDYFIETTGMENSYYTVQVNGYKYLFLSSDQKTVQGIINEEQMDWFKNELAKIDKNEFAFIFVHQPFYDTTSGTLPSQNWHGMTNVGEEIKELLKDYPNIIVYTGHTHYSLECNRSTLFGHGANANYVNNGAVSYLMDDVYEYTVGGHCNFIEVYEDYLIIKGRDLLEGKWISSAQFVCYLY